MRPGKLRHRITHQRAVETVDDYGQKRPAWTALGPDEPAEIRVLSAKEMEQAGQMRAVGDRYLFEGRAFNVLMVTDPDERHVELKLLCQENLNPN